MRRLRPKTVVCVLSLMLPAAIAHAQFADLAKTTPQQRADAWTDAMAAKLDLSPVQLEKVSALNLEFAEKAEPVIKGSGGRFSKIREIRSLETEREKKLESLISTEQFKTFESAKSGLRDQVSARISEETAAAARAP